MNGDSNPIAPASADPLNQPQPDATLSVPKPYNPHKRHSLPSSSKGKSRNSSKNPSERDRLPRRKARNAGTGTGTVTPNSNATSTSGSQPHSGPNPTSQSSMNLQALANGNADPSAKPVDQPEVKPEADAGAKPVENADAPVAAGKATSASKDQAKIVSGGMPLPNSATIYPSPNAIYRKGPARHSAAVPEVPVSHTKDDSDTTLVAGNSSSLIDNADCEAKAAAAPTIQPVPAGSHTLSHSPNRARSRERRSRERRVLKASSSRSRSRSKSREVVPSPSVQVDRGRSRTRKPSGAFTAESLRRRGYHTLYSSFGKEFHVEKRWKMIRDMGCGAYGCVISALDTLTNTPVAIKLVTRVFDKISLAKRALREIVLLRHFANHENITGLIDIDAISWEFNEIYLFLEPMEADLHQIVKSGQVLTNEHVQYFMYQIFRGVKFMHSAHVLHRDLKPGNILVNADCELKICDFGLARGYEPSIHGISEEDAKNDVGALHLTEYVATRWYRAPEIMLAFKGYGPAIDLWSIGTILAELLTGNTLFKGTDYVDQLNKILDVLGSPDDKIMSRIGSKQAQQYVRSLPFRPTKPWSEVVPQADEQALDLLTSLLTFDPAERITVTKAIRHPWLVAYQEDEEEPDCPPPTEKLAKIEKLTTIEEFREALWNEIEEYRREVRCTNLNLSGVPLRTGSYGPYGSGSRNGSVSVGHTASAGQSAAKTGDKEPVATEVKAEPLPAVTETVPSPSSLADDAAAPEQATPAHPVIDGSSMAATAPVDPSATTTASTSTAKGSTPQPAIDRKDSLQPPSPGEVINDPVRAYSIRSHMHQQHSATNSPLVYGLPSHSEEPMPTFSGLPSSSLPPQYIQQVPSGGIPFPSSSTSAYVVPVRSRTASTTGYGVASEFMPRKLLRTLSTVSIHESMDKIGGLAAMGPIGAVIMDRETGADAPPSEMPREFGFGDEENGDNEPGNKGDNSHIASAHPTLDHDLPRQHQYQQGNGSDGGSAASGSGSGRKKRSTIFSV